MFVVLDHVEDGRQNFDRKGSDGIRWTFFGLTISSLGLDGCVCNRRRPTVFCFFALLVSIAILYTVSGCV